MVKKRRAKRATSEPTLTRGEYIACLDSLSSEATEILDNPRATPMARVKALSELVELLIAKATAQGVAEPAPTAGKKPR